MELKKTEKANLESKRRLFTEIGFIIALLLLYAAFEYTSRPRAISELIGGAIEVEEQEIIEITREMEPPPPIEEPAQEPPMAPEIVETDDIEQDQSDAIGATDTEPVQFVFEEPKEVKEQIHIRVEKMPEFPGGMPALQRFIANNLVYPLPAIEMGITGTVLVQFVVNPEGKAVNPEVLVSRDRYLDQAAIDVIHKLPRFTPGEQAGQKVSVYFRVPIVFELQR